MSWHSGTQGTSGTPATDLYNTVTGYMTSWTFIETVAAATAGTTADCKVWRAPGSDWYLIFEPDDTNNRLRVRVSKEYNSATKNVKRYIFANSSATAYTPKADYSYDDTEKTIVTAGYAEVDVNGTGFNWWFGVATGNGSAQDLLYLGTSAGNQKSFMCGFFTPVATGDAVPLFLWASARAASAGWTNASSGGTVRVSHEYGITSSTTGAFCGSLGFLGMTTSSGAIYGSARNLYVSPGIYVFDVLLHGHTNVSGSIGTSGRFYRGTVHQALRCCPSATTAVTLGDVVTVGGTSYFVAGVAGISVPLTTDYALLIDTSNFN